MTGGLQFVSCTSLFVTSGIQFVSWVSGLVFSEIPFVRCLFGFVPPGPRLTARFLNLHLGNHVWELGFLLCDLENYLCELGVLFENRPKVALSLRFRILSRRASQPRHSTLSHMCVCVCLCVSLCVSVCLFVCVSVCLCF